MLLYIKHSKKSLLRRFIKSNTNLIHFKNIKGSRAFQHFTRTKANCRKLIGLIRKPRFTFGSRHYRFPQGYTWSIPNLFPEFARFARGAPDGKWWGDEGAPRAGLDQTGRDQCVTWRTPKSCLWGTFRRGKAAICTDNYTCI